MRPILILLLVALATSQFATAGHCSSWSTSTTSGTTVVLAAPGYYLVLDADSTPTHVYAESNGIGGLQRGDSVDNTCHGMIRADTRVVF